MKEDELASGDESGYGSPASMEHTSFPRRNSVAESNVKRATTSCEVSERIPLLDYADPYLEFNWISFLEPVLDSSNSIICVFSKYFKITDALLVKERSGHASVKPIW